MKRTIYALTLIAALALSANVAIAEHITEPQTPVSSVGMEVYSYPNFSTALTQCNGTEVVIDKNGLIETNVRVETFVRSDSMRLGNPSEHFTEKLTLFVVTNLGDPRREVERYEWSSMWKHSNIPPHANGGLGNNGWESSQNNQNMRAYLPGTILRFTTVVTGAESGLQFTDSCTFKVG